MMCLSIKQPWAWLIVHGWKNIENRTWLTQYRGRVLIHASKVMTRNEWTACALFVRGIHPSLAEQIPVPSCLPRGGIVGEATLLDCVGYYPSNWFCGPYGFVLTDAKPMPFQPCKGRLGFFPEVPA